MQIFVFSGGLREPHVKGLNDPQGTHSLRSATLELFPFALLHLPGALHTLITWLTALPYPTS